MNTYTFCTSFLNSEAAPPYRGARLYFLARAESRHTVSGALPTGRYAIISRLNGKAWDVYGLGREDGANIVQWDYPGGQNQQWSFQPAN